MRTIEQTNTPVGAVVGRWQVDDLHEAHRALIDEVLKHHSKVIAFVGTCDNFGSKKDPLDYPTRAAMLLSHYPSLIVLPIPDLRSDEAWSKQLDNLIRIVAPVGDVMLYGGRDSFVRHYFGQFPAIELDALKHPSGTEVREAVAREVRNSADFRAGVIYGQFNRYPRVHPVVDIAVLREGKEGREFLMGRKKHSVGFQFPGGFIDPTDDNMVMAAQRELMEETHIDIAVDNFKYIGSYIVGDSRVGPGDAMMTTFFMAQYIFGSTSRGEGGDDLESVHWIPLKDLAHIEVVPTHEVLRRALLDFVST